MRPEDVDLSPLRQVAPAAWDALARKRIYFAHQSVGNDVIEGMRDIMRINPRIRLNIVETADGAIIQGPVFAHSRIGRNMDPRSKTLAFADALGQGVGERFDVAFLKLCYVDFDAHTDVAAVFDAYAAMIADVKRRYPRLCVLHVTVPLTAEQGFVKASAKRALGRAVRGREDNIAKARFNAMLRERYEGTDRIFDLAEAESTLPDGRRASFRDGGCTYYRLLPAYTNDGGHLNEVGRRIAGRELLLLLAGLPE